MKRNERQKLRDLSTEELTRKFEETKKELTSLSIQKTTGKLKDLHAYAKKRKEIATLQTIQREKELKK